MVCSRRLGPHLDAVLTLATVGSSGARTGEPRLDGQGPLFMSGFQHVLGQARQRPVFHSRDLRASVGMLK